MSRKLNFNALAYMDGQPVIVHDEEYDAYDQECVLSIKKILVQSPRNKNKMVEIIDKMIFENEEFVFIYSPSEGFLNGKFSVLSKE